MTREPYTNVFKYTTKVQPGFKYRYQFIVNGDIVIDPNQDNSESKLGRLTNYVMALDPSILPDISSLTTSMFKQPSYVHPTMRKMYMQQLIDLKKQTSLINNSSNDVEEEAKEDGLQQLQEKTDNLYHQMQRNKYIIQKLNRLREMLTLAEVA